MCVGWPPTHRTHREVGGGQTLFFELRSQKLKKKLKQTTRGKQRAEEKLSTQGNLSVLVLANILAAVFPELQLSNKRGWLLLC